jgi:hypothetical protein
MEVFRPDIQLNEAAQTYVTGSKEVRDTQWNGRQIRNAFQTAVALAEYEQNPDGKKKSFTVSLKHFKKVVELSRKFEEYIVKAKGAKDSDIIVANQIRAPEEDEDEREEYEEDGRQEKLRRRKTEKKTRRDQEE